MRIWTVLITGMAVNLGLTSAVLAGEAARPSPALPLMGKNFSGTQHIGAQRAGSVAHRWGPRVQGRWVAGWHAPGGWVAYRRPVVGYVLPRYWMSPAYRIGNSGAYGLPGPADGYGWSRYYDDAVMTDHDGRVRDYRHGVDWDEDDGPQPDIAYDDDVTAPSMPPHEYEGRWTGTWRDDKGRTYSGEYEGRFEGEARSNYGVDYDAPPYASAPAMVQHDGAGRPVVTTTHAPGYFAGGYYYPGATTTTVVVQPAMTTTSTYVTEVAAPQRHHARRSARHRCNCK